MESEKNHTHLSFRKRMAERYRRNDCLPGSGTVLWRGKYGATVYGCQKILSYAPERILLLIGRETLEICGEALWCASFSAGSVTVQGRIRALSCKEVGK